MAKYCILGSNAFSGQDFIDLLLDQTDAEIIGLSRSLERADWLLRYKTNPARDRFRFVQLDMSTQTDALLDWLDRERPSHIINFAAQSEVAPSWAHPEHWFQTNTVALARLVNHLRRVDYLTRYLHISSPEAYGSCVGRVTEDAPLNPSTPYAASKAAADMLLSTYARQYGFPLLTVRATNVYGARQQLFKIICRTAINLHLGRRVRLDGGGVAVKSYIHVRDVSHGEWAVLDRGRIGETYNLSPDQGIAVRDVVAAVCRLMGRDFQASTEIGPERPGQDAAYVIDSTKARRDLGWRPTIDLDTGLGEVVDWVNTWWAQIKTQPLDYQHKP